jgi:thioredoxin-dependent peroxiredoxin
MAWYNQSMAEVTLRGNPIHTYGELPQVGSTAPSFSLTGSSLGPVSDTDFEGKTVVLNIFPSIDTPTCATSVRTFNQLAAGRDGATVVCVSVDLPFAQSRFCGAEGIENVTAASAFRSDFGTAYGVSMIDGPLAGLLARAVVVLDEHGIVTYTQLVPEIADEPDYDAALAALD